MASYIEGALIKDETVIAQGNKKILLVILSAFFLIVPFGVWMFTLDAEFILTFGRHNSPYSSPIFVHAFGVVLAALGCLVGLNGIRRLMVTNVGWYSTVPASATTQVRLGLFHGTK